MDWFATIVGAFFIAIGIFEIFFPQAMAKWDKFVGRGPSTKNVHKVLGSIMLIGGVFFIVFFNFFLTPKR